MNLFEAQYYFSENFRCNITYYESETFFMISLSIAFFSPKILGFPSAKNSLTWELKCEN